MSAAVFFFFVCVFLCIFCSVIVFKSVETEVAGISVDKKIPPDHIVLTIHPKTALFRKFFMRLESRRDRRISSEDGQPRRIKLFSLEN